MARRRLPPQPVAKRFESILEVDTAISKLKRRLDEVEALASDQTWYEDPACTNAEKNLETTVLEIFGADSPEFAEFQHYRISCGDEYVAMHPQAHQDNYVAGIGSTIQRLKGMLSRLQEVRLDISTSPPTAAPETSGLVFIGHGRSSDWRILKDFLQDRLGLRHDEFNRDSAAGVSNKERLLQMLNSSVFALLVMTAEDEHSDGTRHSRENVIHEIGLFQGRLGFQRAIVLLEDGCSEFSNIQGVGQLRFPKGKIEAAFEDIRRVLERERILRFERPA